MVTISDPHLRLVQVLSAGAAVWLLVLPALRPLLWSGEPTDIANLCYAVLLAAAVANGLMLRAMTPAASGWRPSAAVWLGCVVLLAALVGSWFSPYPARAWALSLGWILHLAAPLALWPEIRRRPQVLVAGLATGALAELMLVVGQWVCERPALQKAFAADPGLVPQDSQRSQFQVRLDSWRLEGTFLLANTLATYVAMVMPLVAALTISAWKERRPVRWCLVLVVAALIGVLAMTGSKAGILAVMAAAAITACLAWGRKKGAIFLLSAAVLLGGILAASPFVRERLLASADARLGYWQAALTMIAERPLTGHGLNGFEAQYPRVKPPAAEETIIAHQEVLQAAVDLGLPVAVVMIVWWIVLLVRLRPDGSLPPPQSLPPTVGELFAGAALLIFAFLFLDIHRQGFATYPGGRSGAPWWALALIAVMVCGWRLCGRLPLPTPTVCFLGVLACLLHAQADFHLHSPQVVGVVAFVAVLGLALKAGPPSVVAGTPTALRQWSLTVAGMLVLIVVTGGVMVSALRDDDLRHGRQAEVALRRLVLVQAGRLPDDLRDEAMDAVDLLATEAALRGIAPGEHDPAMLVGLAALQELVPASERFPADSDLAYQAVAIATHLQVLRPERVTLVTAWLERLASNWPGNITQVKALADHYQRLAALARKAAARDVRERTRRAQAWAQRAVDLYPVHLPFREDLIALARETGDDETVVRELATIKRLDPIVYPTNRSRGTR